MAHQEKNSLSVDKITFRLFPPYTEKVASLAAQARLTPNQFARMATMAMTDGELLNLRVMLGRLELEIRELRRDLFANEIIRSPRTH